MAKRRRRRLARRKQEVVGDIQEEEETQEEEVPTPKKRVIRRKKVVGKSEEKQEKPPKKVEEPVEEVKEKEGPKRTVKEKMKEPERGKVVFKSEPFADFLSALMNEGKAVLITPNTNDGSFTMQQADPVSASMATGKRLAGVEYWREVANPKYEEWQEERRGMTMEDKVAIAEKLGIDPEVYEHKTDKIKLMRLTAATVKAVGIKKYKKKYRTPASRAAVKAGR